jgi:hypothetical protein
MEKVISPEGSLNDNPRFRRHCEMTGLNSGFSAFVDLEPLIEMLYAEVAKDEEAPKAIAAFNLFGLDKFESFSLHFPFKEGERVKMFISAPGYEGVLPTFFGNYPVGDKPAKVLSADTDAFFAFSINDLNIVMDEALKLAMAFGLGVQQEQIDTQFQMVEQMLGISIREDLLAPFGNYIAFGFNIKPDFDFDVTNPLQLLGAFDFDMIYQIRDPERLVNAFKQVIAAQPGSGIVEEAYGGATIFSAELPFVPVSTGMAIHQGHLIYSLGKGTLKPRIDMINAGNTLAASDEFKSAFKTVPKKATMVGYNSRSYLTDFATAFSKSALDTEDPEQLKVVERLKKLMPEYLDVPPQIGFAVPVDDGLLFESSFSLKSVAYIATMHFISAVWKGEIPIPMEPLE